jgi:formamidopyrimidine-DNA glycosylase
MPELPEVETTLRGIEPFVRDAQIVAIKVRNASLRWPVPVNALKDLAGKTVLRLERRAKYIIWHIDKGALLLHLGMSGSVRVIDPGVTDLVPGKHDHIDITLRSKAGNTHIVRYNDPRRFGCCLWVDSAVESHPLLVSLGPEPLQEEFDAAYLFARSRGRKVAIKNLIMDGKVVVGVGNIYASEALFRAGIRPGTAAKRLTRRGSEALVAAIKYVLAKAIQAGGTTLNDFSQSDGRPGYFRIELQVYGRAGEPCFRCGERIKSTVHGQRSTFYCATCQQ